MSGKTSEEAVKRTDRRVLRTRDTLGDALVELMHEKAFDAITVQDVLDRAGVGRATFYAHYSDKHDLLLSDVEDFFTMFSGSLTRNGADVRRLAPVAEFLSHLREAREFLAAMRASGRINDIEALGRGIFARAIEQRLRAAGVAGNDMEISVRAYALAGNIFSLASWWIDKDMKIEPQEMDAIFHRMAWDGMK